jgi:hypothetical protein
LNRSLDLSALAAIVSFVRKIARPQCRSNIASGGASRERVNSIRQIDSRVVPEVFWIAPKGLDRLQVSLRL